MKTLIVSCLTVMLVLSGCRDPAASPSLAVPTRTKLLTCYLGKDKMLEVKGEWRLTDGAWLEERTREMITTPHDWLCFRVNGNRNPPEPAETEYGNEAL
jgi:hypothetical protein